MAAFWSVTDFSLRKLRFFVHAFVVNRLHPLLTPRLQSVPSKGADSLAVMIEDADGHP
jgi:hypothetical protein